MTYKTVTFFQKIILLIITFLSFNVFAINLKIATVNVSGLLEKAPQVIKSSKKIAEEFKPKEKEIIALAKELQAMKKKYNKNKSIMSADKARVFERKIIAQQKKVQRLRNDIQEDINIRKNQALQKIQDLINQSITFVGKKNNYDIIFYEGIAYNNDKADITPLVLKRLKAIDK